MNKTEGRKNCETVPSSWNLDMTHMRKMKFKSNQIKYVYLSLRIKHTVYTMITIAEMHISVWSILFYNNTAWAGFVEKGARQNRAFRTCFIIWGPGSAGGLEKNFTTHTEIIQYREGYNKLGYFFLKVGSLGFEKVGLNHSFYQYSESEDSELALVHSCSWWHHAERRGGKFSQCEPWWQDQPKKRCLT
jgi:hypothetical protein